ncbi:unnamed protein product, partial [Discosporangium mesarthrocarpum]
MGNSGSLSLNAENYGPNGIVAEGRSKAERWATSKRFVSLVQVLFPDVSLETVLLLPKSVFLNYKRIPTFREAEVYLRPASDLMGRAFSARSVYLSCLPDIGAGPGG